MPFSFASLQEEIDFAFAGTHFKVVAAAITTKRLEASSFAQPVQLEAAVIMVVAVRRLLLDLMRLL